jgi:hypothetical protein
VLIFLNSTPCAHELDSEVARPHIVNEGRQYGLKIEGGLHAVLLGELFDLIQAHFNVIGTELPFHPGWLGAFDGIKEFLGKV